MLSSIDQPNSKRVVIVGCGRIGLSIAVALAERRHVVHLLDIDPAAYEYLPENLVDEGLITPTVGDGTLEDDLSLAAVQKADVFVAASDQDSVNALAAQMAQRLFHVPKVICRVSDPAIEEMYGKLGLATINPAAVVTGMVVETTESR